MKKELAMRTQNIGKYFIIMDLITSMLDLKETMKLGKKMKDKSINPYTRFTSYLILHYASWVRGGGSLSTGQLGDNELTDSSKEYLESLNEKDKQKAISQLRSPVITDIVGNFFASKNINIEKKVVKNLLNTKNKLYFRKCPFESMMIPLDITIDNRFEIFCILIQDTYITSREKEAIKFTMFGIDKEDGVDFWRTNFIYPEGVSKANTNNKVFDKWEQNKIDNDIANLIVNILDFMNHPDVETKTIKWPYNKRRQKRGQLPINDRIDISIKGKLYKYIYEQENINSGKEVDCKFWVRGHFIHFWNKKRYSRLYNMDQERMKRSDYYIDGNGVVSKWVLPYIKGNGELKNKAYNLKNK